MNGRDLALLTTSVLATLGALEVGCRLLEAPRERAQQQLSASGYLVHDPELEYDILPNHPKVTQPGFETVPPYPIWSNELGCFDTPYDKRRDARPILLVGDSFTQGMMFEHNWGTVLEKLLGRRVLKCGVVGYGTEQELKKARKLIKAGIRPSVIVVGHYVNDINDDYLSPGRTTVVRGRIAAAKMIADFETGAVKVKTREELERTAELFEQRGEVIECPSNTLFQRLKCWLYLRSALYRRVKPPLKALLERFGAASRLAERVRLTAPGALKYVAFSPSKPWVEEAWRRHLRWLDGFKSLAREAGAELLIVLIPKREQVYPFLAPASFDLPEGYDLEVPNRRLRDHMSARGIPFIDLLEPMRARADQTPRPALDAKKDLYWPVDLHWNRNGHALAAELVAERLKGKRR